MRDRPKLRRRYTLSVTSKLCAYYIPSSYFWVQEQLEALFITEAFRRL